jgi:hypothetical protein
VFPREYHSTNATYSPSCTCPTYQDKRVKPKKLPNSYALGAINNRRIIWPDFNTGTGLETATEEARMPPVVTLSRESLTHPATKQQQKQRAEFQQRVKNK